MAGRQLSQSPDNNVMHAKPDLRVILKWTITRSGSVITDVIQLMRSLFLFIVIAIAAGCVNSGDDNNLVMNANSADPDRVELSDYTDETLFQFSDAKSIVVSQSSLDSEPIKAQRFKTLLARATSIAPTDKLLKDWHYVPWCQVTFESRGREWNAMLFLGGLACIADDQGTKGHIMLDLDSAKR